jgi:hypothetical protein
VIDNIGTISLLINHAFRILHKTRLPKFNLKISSQRKQGEKILGVESPDEFKVIYSEVARKFLA